MKKISILLITICLAITEGYSSSILRGKVSYIDEKGDSIVLPYATVFWENTTINAQTKEDGSFTINKPKGSSRIIASYVGYKADSIAVMPNDEYISIVLSANSQIEAVTVTKNTDGNYISVLKPMKTEIISQAGLQKLACCNLSESFQNNASIDVGFADAVTGARQIQMLGLSGTYSQLMFENIPIMRGLAIVNGMSYIPGSWMESIQISKGTSSVLNGYESVTGQINIEFKKPEDAPLLFVNLYGGDNSRLELNTNGVIVQNNKWNGMLMTHVSGNFNKMDENGDSFIEQPIARQVNVFNRWKYTSDSKKLAQQFGFRYMNEQKQGGQMDFSEKSDLDKGIYGFESKINNFQLYSKTGIMIDSSGFNSIGLVTSYTYYNNNSFFGYNNYDGRQNSIYANLIYQTIVKTTSHKVSAGIGSNYDHYSQSLNDSAFVNKEFVPGIFAQYTWTPSDKFTAMVGSRYDHNSRYGWYLTPRVHLKYEPFWGIVLRTSVGRGMHSAEVIAENLNYLVSSRRYIFTEQLNLEKAWNYGFNITKTFAFTEGRSIQWSADYYHTTFDNQVVVDIDANPQSILVYNLKGKSYSDAFQTDLNVQPLKGLEITAAYRINDVKQTVHGELKSKPFVVTHRGLVSASYAFDHRKWQFDATTQFNGRAPLPNTSSNPAEYQLPQYSPAFFNVLAQVTRRFKHFEIYIGGENLTNYTQKNPVIAANAPFSNYFDASMVWGPVTGRMLYAGIRYTLKN